MMHHIQWGKGIREKAFKPRRALKVPLHLPPMRPDEPQDIRLKRLLLHVEMSQLNPQGWRTPGKRSGITKSRRSTRMERLGVGL